MSQWLEGDILSPTTLNLRQASASSTTGFSTNTLRPESGASTWLQPNTAAFIGRSLDSGGAVFNVRALGATGDGSTDDTTIIQAAINRASGGSAVVYFPPGTYAVSSALSLFSRTALLGAGRASSQITALSNFSTAASQSMISMGNTTYVSIEALRFSKANAVDGYGIDLGRDAAPCTDATLRDLWVEGNTRLGSLIGGRGTQIHMENIELAGPTTLAQSGWANMDTYLTDATLINVYARSNNSSAGLHQNASIRVRYIGCVADDTFNAFSNESNTRDITYLDCVASNFSNYGLQWSETGSVDHRWIGGRFSGRAAGINIGTRSNVSGLIIWGAAGQQGNEVNAGIAIGPAYAFSSEASLGFYRSAASTIATSYGTLDVSRSAFLPRVVTSANSTSLASGELSIASLSVTSVLLAYRSGNTTYTVIATTSAVL